MGSRLELDALLKTLGTNHVYFQPPSGFQMIYPCITYQVSNADTRFADNIPYRYKKRWQITVMDKDPDSSIPGKVASLPQCTFDRHFATNGLNHDVFVMWF